MKPDELFGDFTYDVEFDWHISQPIIVPCLDGRGCQFIISSGQISGKLPADLSKYRTAVQNFIVCGDYIWKSCSIEMYNYYTDIRDQIGNDDDKFPVINDCNDVWKHVQLGYGYDGKPAGLKLDEDDSGDIFISIEGGCDWEPEHGVQVVIKNGLAITKLGPYDGHLTNEQAYGRKDFKGIIYVSSKMLWG